MHTYTNQHPTDAPHYKLSGGTFARTRTIRTNHRIRTIRTKTRTSCYSSFWFGEYSSEFGGEGGEGGRKGGKERRKRRHERKGMKGMKGMKRWRENDEKRKRKKRIAHRKRC